MRLHPARWLRIAVVVIGLAASQTVHAQYSNQPVLAPPPPVPLMYLRFTGPAGAKLTIYRGFDAGQTLELPCKVGFRPGYAYRLAISEVPSFPRQIFCPSLEVRGTLALIPQLRNADFPAHIRFTDDDFLKVLSGSHIKKVITLERPDQALPIATKADTPLEVPVAGGHDVYAEAAQRGEPLVVFQMGQRFLTPQELNAQALPGTILLPSDKALGLPRVAPYLLWKWCPVYDPVIGPRSPSEFMTLYDGGDSGAQAGFNRFGKLKGLDPTDTVAEYLDSKGNQRLAVSNRVALCVPRFIVFTSETSLASQMFRTSSSNALALKTPQATLGQLALKEGTQQTHPEAVGTQMRLSGAYQLTSTSISGRMLGLDVRSNLRSAEAVEAVTSPMKAEPLDGPLRIIKWPDKACVNIGEIVTFYLKYTNTGGQPITHVVVSDSLTARLEYVQGSTKTDRDALFTTQPNEAGSAVLRWEFTGALQPRENGLITFQVRVR